MADPHVGARVPRRRNAEQSGSSGAPSPYGTKAENCGVIESSYTTARSPTHRLARRIRHRLDHGPLIVRWLIAEQRIVPDEHLIAGPWRRSELAATRKPFGNRAPVPFVAPSSRGTGFATTRRSPSPPLHETAMIARSPSRTRGLASDITRSHSTKGTGTCLVAVVRGCVGKTGPCRSALSDRAIDAGSRARAAGEHADLRETLVQCHRKSRSATYDATNTNCGVGYAPLPSPIRRMLSVRPSPRSKTVRRSTGVARSTR